VICDFAQPQCRAVGALFKTVDFPGEAKKKKENAYDLLGG
jgi:hypothetical protein